MTYINQEVRRENEHGSHGLLAYRDVGLVAVLSRWEPTSKGFPGRWHLECGFSVSDLTDHSFPDLHAACTYFDGMVGQSD